MAKSNFSQKTVGLKQPLLIVAIAAVTMPLHSEPGGGRGGGVLVGDQDMPTQYQRACVSRRPHNLKVNVLQLVERRPGGVEELESNIVVLRPFLQEQQRPQTPSADGLHSC